MKPFTPLRGLGPVALLALAVGLPACQGAGAFAQVSEKLNQISDNQTQILARLDKLETKIDQVKAAPAAAPPGKQQPQGPRPGQPDPAATYKVAVAPTDHAKGPADALVTVVEWSDFQ